MIESVRVGRNLEYRKVEQCIKEKTVSNEHIKVGSTRSCGFLVISRKYLTCGRTDHSPKKASLKSRSACSHYLRGARTIMGLCLVLLKSNIIRSGHHSSTGKNAIIM